VKKIETKYDEVIITTEDGGHVWKQYDRQGKLRQKQKYMMCSLAEVKRRHPEAMVIKLAVLGR
jgi:hypothetical protein